MGAGQAHWGKCLRSRPPAPPSTPTAFWVARLSAVDQEEILRRSKTDFFTNKAALRFAQVILSKYNSQQHRDRKLPYYFKG